MCISVHIAVYTRRWMHRADAYRLKTFLLVGENDLLGMGQWSLTYDAYLWANKLRSILVEDVGYVMRYFNITTVAIFLCRKCSFISFRFDNIISKFYAQETSRPSIIYISIININFEGIKIFIYYFLFQLYSFFSTMISAILDRW